MPLRDFVPLFRFIGTIMFPVFYIVSFASKNWVADDDREFGLWTWCYTNFTDEGDVEDYVNDSSRCHSIDPGDSPAYYEGLRVVTCFTLISYILFFFTFNENEGLGKEHNPIKVYFGAAVMTSACIGTLANNYDDDERWKYANFRLGWCFWLVVSSGVGSLLMIPLFLKYLEMKKPNNNNNNNNSSSNNNNRSSPATVTPAAAPQAAGADNGQRRASIAVSVSSSDSSTTVPPPPKNTTLWGRRVSDAGQRGRGREENSGSSNQYPVLELPRYELPSERSSGLLPNTPPPSYEDVVRGGYASAPPPYLP